MCDVLNGAAYSVDSTGWLKAIVRSPKGKAEGEYDPSALDLSRWRPSGSLVAPHPFGYCSCLDGCLERLSVSAAAVLLRPRRRGAALFDPFEKRRPYLVQRLNAVFKQGDDLRRQGLPLGAMQRKIGPNSCLTASVSIASCSGVALPVMFHNRPLWPLVKHPSLSLPAARNNPH